MHTQTTIPGLLTLKSPRATFPGQAPGTTPSSLHFRLLPFYLSSAVPFSLPPKTQQTLSWVGSFLLLITRE